MRARPWLAFLVVFGIALIAYPFTGSGWFGASSYLSFSLAAGIAAFVGVRLHRPPHRLGWYLLGIGVLCWFGGDLLWYIYDLALETSPFPSLADVVYLAGYFFLTAGLISLARSRVRVPGYITFIDSAIFTVAATTIFWVLLIEPYAGPSATTLEKIVSGMYPIGDLLLFGALVRVLLPGRRPTLALGLVAAGITVTAVGDIQYLAHTLTGTGNLMLQDLTWLVSYMLMGAAFLHPTIASAAAPVSHASDELSRRRLVALTIATLVAPLIVVTQAAGESGYSVFAGVSAAVLFLLVLARMAGLVTRIQEQADQMAVMARTDPLTGVGNRGAWEESLAVELDRAKRLGTKLSIVMLDLDHFKDFNDRMGHLGGDQHLRGCVEAWRPVLRSIDTLTRFGGEEFAVLLPGCELDDAVNTAERLRTGVPAGETCSAGVAMWDGEESPTDLVGRADRALYDAKDAGRARTMAAALAVFA